MKVKDYKKELRMAIKIAKKAGRIMLKYFDGDQHIEVKSDRSFVTIADKEINSLVIKMLQKYFPEDGIIGEEESTAEYGMGRRWICDPIDGTAGYVWGVPTAMFSLGLVVDGVPTVGVAYDPFLKKIFTGIKGQKSKCNNKVISVSTRTLKDSGIVGVSGGVKRLVDSPFFRRLIEEKVRVACFSGAVYKCCLVATGKFVGYVENVNPHDLAASHVIIEGAGGKVTDFNNQKLDYTKVFKGAVISNGIVHDELVSYIQVDN